MAISRRAALGAIGSSAFSSLVLPSAGLAAPRIALPTDIVSSERSTITQVRTSRPVVAMTFDDGPHPRLTPILLDMLKARRIRATFYVIGNRVPQWPGLVQRMLAEGHEVANHTWSHPFLTRLSSSGVLSQLDRTAQAVEKVTGRRPVTMRPPYGAMSYRQRQMVLEARKLPTVLWSVDPQDWRRPGSSVVAQRILHQTRPGGIVLSHDIHSPTIKAMPRTLDGLAAKGFRFVTVSELLGWPRWGGKRGGSSRAEKKSGRRSVRGEDR